MSFQIDEFSTRTGLAYDRRAKVFWGIIRRYPVFIQRFRGGTLMFSLSGYCPAPDGIGKKLEEFRLAHPGMSLLQYKERTLACVFSIPPGDAVTPCVQTVTELVAFAADLSFIPCCTACGRPEDFAPRLLDNTGVSVCPECEKRLCGDFVKLRNEAKAKKPNYPLLAAAMLGGALAVLLLVYCSADLARSGYFGAYIGTMICLLLVQKLGKKVTMPIAVTACVLCFAASAAATMQVLSASAAHINQSLKDEVSAFIQIYEEHQNTAETLSPADVATLRDFGIDPEADIAGLAEEYNACTFAISHQTTESCRADFLDILSIPMYRNIRSAFIRYNILDLIAVFACGALVLPKMLRESSGVHTLREPES